MLFSITFLLKSWYPNYFNKVQLLLELLIPFLSNCTMLVVPKNNMGHHTPWRNQDYLDLSPCAQPRDLFLYLRVNEGWQLSDFSSYLGRQGTIEACLQFPQFIEGRLIHLLEFFLADRLEDSDFGAVSQAILAKREAKLRELIGLDYDLGKPDRFGMTPLHLSVYWPLGMKILLAAGVQPNGGVLGHPWERTTVRITPLKYAIQNRQDEAILLLLHTDSVKNERHNSVVPEIMRYGYKPSSRIITAAIETMVQRSNRLRSLAIAHLSPRELDRLCISREDGPLRILDAYAAPTVNALENVGVKIPEALETDWVVATVYHDLWMFSPELADRLWSSGFRDTNFYDQDGFTPLHQACVSLRLDIASWLMSRGGDPTTVVRRYSLNAFHLLSPPLSHYFLCGGHAFNDMLPDGPHMDVVTRIAGLCGASSRDGCSCACSPQGCTPTTVLLRRATATWYKKKNSFLPWTRLLDLSPNTMETCCLEFARLETFERLGITHVCCKIRRTHVADPMPQDTIEEIQDEESEMIDQLESWMVLYEEERAKFEGPAIEFLDKWSDMLRDELDVPAAFEGYWSRRVKTGESKCMPDYFGVGDW